MSEINWKTKYQELKGKFMESVDMAFRLGFEQGQQSAQQDAMMQQQQQQADQMAAQQQGDQAPDGQEQPQGEEPQQSEPDSAHPAGSELDQHISTLESMVNKSEISPTDLLKAIGDLRTLQKSMVTARELKKSADAIPGIVKALHKPSFKISQQANHNMSSAAKSAVSMQEKIVSDVMKSWAEEESRLSKDILGRLGVEGLTQKD